MSLLIIDDPWVGARQDRSDFPDVDQMIQDLGPLFSARDAALERWLEKIAFRHARVLSQIDTVQMLLDCAQPIR